MEKAKRGVKVMQPKKVDPKWVKKDGKCEMAFAEPMKVVQVFNRYSCVR